MIPRNRIPAHPGRILNNEFLVPKEITQVAFAKKLGIPVQSLNLLVNGKKGVTAQMAWKLSEALGTSPQFWMNLQTNHDLALARLSVKRAR